MADNTQLNVGVSGDEVRAKDLSLSTVTPINAKTQIIQIDKGGQAMENLVSEQNPLPVTIAAPFVSQDVPLSFLATPNINNSLVPPVGSNDFATGVVDVVGNAGACTMVLGPRYGEPGRGRIAGVFVNQGGATATVCHSIDATTGCSLAPGASRTFPTMHAVYMFTPNGLSTNVDFVEYF